MKTKIAVWCDEGRQPAIETEYPERRRMLESARLRAAAARANRAALKAALQEGRRYEGAWAMGIHAGSIGLELVRAPAGGAVFDQRHEVRIYDPANPAMYRSYLGTVQYAPRRVRHELVVAGKSGGIDGDPARKPTLGDFLDQGVRVIALYGDGDELRGCDDVGTFLQLHPKGSAAATALTADPRRVASQPFEPVPAVDPLGAAVWEAAPPALARDGMEPRELHRWDVYPDPLPAMVISRVEQVAFAREGRAIYWVHNRAISRAGPSATRAEVTMFDCDALTSWAGSASLLTYCNNYFRLRDPDTLREVGPPDPERPGQQASPGCSCVTAVGASNIAYGDGEGFVRLIDARGKKLREFRQAGSVVGLAATGDLLLSSTTDGHVNMWDLRTGENRGQVRDLPCILTAARSADGGVLALTALRQSPSERCVRIFDLRAGRDLARLDFRDAQFVALSPDWRRLLVGKGGARVHLIDLETGRETAQLVGHKRQPTSAVWSADGKTALTGGGDGWIVQWAIGR